MIERTRSLTRHLVVAAAALLAACDSDATGPIDTGTEAARAAQAFTELADSVARNGGDATVGGAYSGIAGILRTGGRVSPIVLTIDGVATTFLATAMTTETTVNDCPPNAQCFAPPQKYTLRSLIAWDRDNPTRLVQLSSASNDEQIGAILDPSPLALYARMASLVYMDGAGGTFIGTSGTQKIDVGNGGSPCPAGAESDSTLRILKLNGTCTLADHAVTFSGKVEPSPFVVTGNTAKGTHTIAMSTQTVAGTRRTMTIDNFPCANGCVPIDSVPHPPVVIGPGNTLPAKLSAAVNGDVTLTFTVTNTSKEQAKVVFPSGQKYDFAAVDSATGKEAWRWSKDKGFTQAVIEQTVPAGGSLTFVEKWKPASKGLYLVRASLTSSSHRSEAYASVVVP